MSEKHGDMRAPAIEAVNRLDALELASCIAMLAALVSMIIADSLIASLCFLLGAIAGWTGAFELVRIQCGFTVLRQVRIAVVMLFALAGGTMLVISVKHDQTEQAAVANTQKKPHWNERYPKRSDDVVKAEGLASERSNKSKIEALRKDANSLAPRDYEGRLKFWTEITALAPANMGYESERRNLAAKVATLTNLGEEPAQGAYVESVRSRKEGFGNVLVIDIAIRNDSRSNLKDFQIVCDSAGKSGTRLDQNVRILFEVVPPRTTRTFQNVNMGLLSGQASRTRCSIDHAVIA